MTDFLQSMKRRVRRAWKSIHKSRHVDSFQTNLEFRRLEPRRVLNADFALSGSMLTLDGFTEVAEENLAIYQDEASYQFQLSEGDWSNAGGSAGGITGAGTSTLVVPFAAVDSLAGGILVDDSLSIALDVLGRSDFAGLSGPIEYRDINDLTLDVGVGGLEIDSLAILGDLSVTVAGPISDSPGAVINVAGDAQFESGALATDFDLDGQVNKDDLTTWQANFGSTSSTRQEGDASGNGLVDGADFLLWQRQFNQQADSSNTITLADQNAATNSLVVGGNASFQTFGQGNVDVGVEQATGLPTNANVRLGSLSFLTDADADANTSGRVRIAEDDAMTVVQHRFRGNSTDELSRGGTVKLQTSMELSLASDLVASRVFLMAGTTIDQQAAGAISASELAIRSGGNTTLTLNNDVGKLAADVAGDFQFQSNTDLELAAITVDGMTVSGIDVAANKFALSATGAVTQTAAIRAQDLLLTGVGPFSLANASNDIGVLAINTTGDVQFTETNGFEVGAVMGVSGADVGANKLTFSAGGAVTQTATVKARELLLLGTGPYTLTNTSNNIDTLAVNASGDVQFTDADGFAIRSILAGDNLTATATLGNITDENNASINVTNDATFVATGAVVLNDMAGDSFTVGGQASFAGASIDVGDAGTFNAKTLNFNSGGAVTIQEDSATEIAIANTADSLDLRSSGDISDAVGTSLVVTKDATFVATGAIALNDMAADILTIGGKASFAGSSINVGDAGTFNANTLNFNSGGAVTIQEDSATEIAMANTADSLDLRSGGDMTDAVGTNLIVTGDATFVAAGAIALNDMVTDVLTIGGKASFAGSSINVGDAGTFNARTLNFNSGGSVTIQEDSAMEIAMANIADSLDLRGSGDMTDAAGTSIVVTRDATLTSDNGSIGKVGSIFKDDANFNLLEITVGGNLTANAPNGSIAVDVSVAGTVTLVANTNETIFVQSAGNVQAAWITSAVTNLALVSVNGTVTIGNSLTVVGDMRLEGDDIVAADGTIDLIAARLYFKSNESETIQTTIDQLDVVVNDTADTDRENFKVTNTKSLVLVDLDCDADKYAAKIDGDFEVIASGTLSDADGVKIDVAGNATFVATGSIVLNDKANDVLTVGGKASFTGTSVNVGGNAGTFNANTLSFSSSGAVTIQEDSATEIEMSNTAGSLDLRSSGDITDSGVVDVDGMAQFNAVAGSITLDQLDVFGSISLNSLTTATIVNTTSVDLKASTVGTDLVVTATAGNITDGGVVDVNGMAQFNAAAGSITLDQLDVFGSIGLNSLTTATIVNTTSVDLKASTVGTDLVVTATAGNITDSGAIDVDGMAQFNAATGSITLDQLDVSGSIGLNSMTTATIVNTTSVDLKASTVGTDLVVTATAGNITDRGVVDVNGMAQFNAAAGSITLDQLDVSGSIGLNSLTNATIVNLTDIDFKTTTVGGDLTATALAGNITQSGTLTITGTSTLDAGNFDITLTDANNDFVDSVHVTANDVMLADKNSLVVFGGVVGSIGVTTVNDATITNNTKIDFKESTVGGNLSATAISGNITNTTGALTVGGMAAFTTNAANADITLGTVMNFEVAGALGLMTNGATGNATIKNQSAIDFKATSVGGALDATAVTGNITDTSGDVKVTGMARFETEAINAFILLDRLQVDGMIGVVTASGGDATITNANHIDFKTTVVGANLTATATLGNITNTGGSVTVAGMAQYTAANGSIGLTTDVTGMIGLTSGGNATITNANNIDFKTTAVGANLTATATQGNISNTGGSVTVTGMAQFSAANGFIDLTTDVTGMIGLTSGGNATITNANGIDFKTTSVGANLTATATQGNITDAALTEIAVQGNALLTANLGNIILANHADARNLLDVDGRATFITLAQGSIDVGVLLGGSDAAARVTLGSLYFRADNDDITANSGRVRIVEDEAMLVDRFDFNQDTVLDANAGGDVFLRTTSGNLSIDSMTVHQLLIEAADEILDQTDALISVTREGSFIAGGRIELGDGSADSLFVGELAHFSSSAGSINVGVNADGSAGDAQVAFGKVNFTSGDGISTGNQVRIAEDVVASDLNPGMLLTSVNTAGDLVLRSGGDLREEDGVSSSVLVVNNAVIQAKLDIELANESSSTNRLRVGQHAAFSSNSVDDIDVGVLADGSTAAATVNLGSLSFTTGDGLTSGGTVRISEDANAAESDAMRGTLLAAMSRAGNLELSSGGNIEDVDDATLDVAATTQLSVDRDFNDIILGDGPNNVINFNDLDIVSARHVSMQVDQQNPGQHLFLVGATLNNNATVQGTLYITAENNHIIQNTTSTLVAHTGVFHTMQGAVVLTRTDFQRFAATTLGSTEITRGTTTSPHDLDALVDRAVLDAIETKLVIGTTSETDISDDVLRDLNPTNDDLRPVEFDASDDALKRKSTSPSYGLVLGTNEGDLTVGLAHDAAVSVQDTTGNERQSNLPGISVDAGGAYISTSGKLGEAGDLTFSGAGAAGAETIKIENDGVFTAVAGGKLFIEVGAGTILKSSTGVVLNVGTDPSFPNDGYDGRTELVEPKSGPQVSFTPPSNDSDALTTATVKLLDKLQNIHLEIGVAGEENFVADVLWADSVGLLSPLTPVNQIDNVTDSRSIQDPIELAGEEDFLHKFEFGFLESASANPNFPFLPTEVRVFNDTNINLFENADSADAAGIRNLNRSITVFNATTFRQDNFLLVLTGSPPPPLDLPAGPERPLFFTPPTSQSVLAVDQALLPRIVYADSGTFSAFQYDSVVYGKIENRSNLVDPQVWKEGAKGDWEGKIEKEVRGNDKYLPGEYEIRAKRADGEMRNHRFQKAPEDEGAAEEEEESTDHQRLNLPGEEVNTDEIATRLQQKNRRHLAWQHWSPQLHLASKQEELAKEMSPETSDAVPPQTLEHEPLDDVSTTRSTPFQLPTRRGATSASTNLAIGTTIVGSVLMTKYQQDKEALNWRNAWLRHLLDGADFDLDWRDQRRESR